MRKIKPLISPSILPFLVILFSFIVAFPVVYFISDKLLAAALIGLIIGLSFYLFYKFVVEKYLNERIKVLYKNIHEVKISSRQNTPNSIDKAEEEVDKWKTEYQFKIDEFKSREKYRREFIGNVSHELKTPIFNIQGYIL